MGAPRHLFASRVDPAKDSASKRPRQTLRLLSQRLGIAVDDACAKGEEAALGVRVMASSDSVLIVWEHKRIHVIANGIMGNKVSVPQDWPDERFDLVWVFDRHAESWTFTQVPQLLLAGDRPDRIT
jgi:hypothetical protein